MLAEITTEELDAALDMVAVEALEEAGVEGPPVDALAVAAALRIAVAVDDAQRGRARYVRLRALRGVRSKPSILLRSDPRPERRQWAVAHEIGEHVAWRVFERLGVDPREVAGDARESVANQLAGRLLLPARWFEADAVAGGWDLLELKSRYATASHELIARRMLEFSPPVIVTVFDHSRISLRHSNLPGRVPPLSEAELDCWRRVHRRNHPWNVEAEGQIVTGWPIHEEEWQREILRTEIDIWADQQPTT
ncbi:MAG: ImmA/IrrE family metallo-endopeptidase [Pirellulales bacterium]|nr:ImmA/IrrE family metallo-endopeptidase [Pirellulales bacterium]